MISTVTATTDPTAAETSMKQSLGMNKDDFMKLFIAQLQYQDPLKPQDPSAMLDQLSQLSLVEQSYNSNTALTNLLAAQNNSISMSALSLIGKNVQANGNSVSFDGSSSTNLQFNLPVAASSVQISIIDSSGKTVKTGTLGQSSAGNNIATWDGTDNSGALLPAGLYSFSVSATAANGNPMTATTYTSGQITGVNLTGSAPVLTIGSASVALSDVINVGG